jgi:hypothetical protein
LTFPFPSCMSLRRRKSHIDGGASLCAYIRHATLLTASRAVRCRTCADESFPSPAHDFQFFHVVRAVMRGRVHHVVTAVRCKYHILDASTSSANESRKHHILFVLGHPCLTDVAAATSWRHGEPGKTGTSAAGATCSTPGAVGTAHVTSGSSKQAPVLCRTDSKFKRAAPAR